jgi:hypothetical protein
MFAVPVTPHEVDTNPVSVEFHRFPIRNPNCRCIKPPLHICTLTCNTVMAIKLAVGLCGPLDDSDLKARNPPDRWQPKLMFVMSFSALKDQCAPVHTDLDPRHYPLAVPQEPHLGHAPASCPAARLQAQRDRVAFGARLGPGYEPGTRSRL